MPRYRVVVLVELEAGNKKDALVIVGRNMTTMMMTVEAGPILLVETQAAYDITPHRFEQT